MDSLTSAVRRTARARPRCGATAARAPGDPEAPGTADARLSPRSSTTRTATCPHPTHPMPVTGTRRAAVRAKDTVSAVGRGATSSSTCVGGSTRTPGRRPIASVTACRAPRVHRGEEPPRSAPARFASSKPERAGAAGRPARLEGHEMPPGQASVPRTGAAKRTDGITSRPGGLLDFGLSRGGSWQYPRTGRAVGRVSVPIRVGEVPSPAR